ncbi:MAG TPA: HAMP domain-containing sensor histidine kinase [Motilibacterales bacterium]|nr:HAMP domain-containing sensor histidine kinase [Motilibacterales bacterium]
MSRTSLSRRLPLVMAGVAAIAVLIGALVAWPLLRAAADSTAQRTLSRTADLTAELLQRTYAGEFSMGPRGGVSTRLEALLAPQQVTAYVVAPTSVVERPLRDSDVAVVTSGGEVTDRRPGLSEASYVEGRPVADGIGVLLVQPAAVARDVSTPALGRLAMALALGLLVAVVIGYWVARRLTRPLVQAAAAANAMSSGQRDVRIDPEGPSEVADIAIALNRLSQALNESEGRQREFFLTVSHELRTPLTSVKGYAEALADGVVPPEDVPVVAGVVRSEADHLDRLVADLLDLARLGAVDVAVEPVDLDLAVLGADAAMLWADRAARSGVRFVDEVVRTPHPVRTDPVRVRQIIDNLMENALRVTGEGAPVVLRISAGPAAGEFLVEVRDGGPGLTADDLSVAFEPGELHARYRGLRKVGSGVGLALVARLAERLGGRARAGSAPEGGAAFLVVLPSGVPTQAGVSRPSTPATGPQGAAPTIPS